MKYWNKEGKYQEAYSRLFDELVPDEGEAPTVHGELLRCVSRIYYDIYNNGGWNLDSDYYRWMGLTLVVHYDLYREWLVGYSIDDVRDFSKAPEDNGFDSDEDDDSDEFETDDARNDAITDAIVQYVDHVHKLNLAST